MTNFEGPQSVVNPYPNLMKSIMVTGFGFGTGAFNEEANGGVFTRMVAPITGTVANLSVLTPDATGELRAAILDCGQTVATEYTLLAESSSVAKKAEWTSMGTMGGLEVTAGQNYMVGAMPSETGGKFTGLQTITIVGCKLPAETLGTTSESKVIGKHKYGEYKFATLKEAELEAPASGANQAPAILVRITPV